MKSTDNRNLFKTLIGANASSSDIVTIPAEQATAGDGTAAIDIAFPPETFVSVSAGGKRPRGQDMNGFLNLLSASIQSLQADFFGPYDAAFSSAIGGYPLNSIVSAGVAGAFWVSTVENNTTTPGAYGASWKNLFSGYLPITGGTLTGGLTVSSGDINLSSGRLIANQHNGSDTSGSLRWGGSLISSIGGASPSSINLCVNEIVGQTTTASLQINCGGSSSPSYFTFDQRGGITGPAGAFALQSDLAAEVSRAEGAESSLQSSISSETSRAQNAEATKVAKSGDIMTGGLIISGGGLYCGYGAGWGGGTTTGSIRWTNAAAWWGNPNNSSPVAFAGLLQVTDIIGNANADRSGLNFGGYDFAGNRHDWYLAWNGNVTTPAGKLAFQSQLPTNPVQGTSSGELIQSFTFTGNNNTTISFPRAFSGTPTSVNLTVSSNNDADHYAMNWTAGNFFLGIFGGASSVQFSCIAVGPA